MPAHHSPPPTRTSYRSLLARREFFGLYASFTLTSAAATMSGFALGSLVHASTGSPLLTSIAMYGPAFATVLGAFTLMSVADGDRPRRTLLTLQMLSLAGVTAQTIAGLPMTGRFVILFALGFVQSLNTGVRMGLLAEVVLREQYALARSLMNITSGGMQILGYAVGAALLKVVAPSGVFTISAVLTAVGLLTVAVTIRERSVRITRRPGLSATWRTNRALFAHPGVRALLVNLWVPNGLIVGCEGLLLSYDEGNAGLFLAAGSAGMLVGDLTVGRLLDVEQRRHCAFVLRVMLAAPVIAFAVQPPTVVGVLAMLIAGAGFAATLPLQERLLDLTSDPIRGQVQGVESAGRIAWQGVGAVTGGCTALLVTPAAAIGILAAVSLLITVTTRPALDRSRPLGSPVGVHREMLR